MFEAPTGSLRVSNRGVGAERATLLWGDDSAGAVGVHQVAVVVDRGVFEVVVADLTLGSTHFSGNVEEGLKDLKVSNALGVREDGSHDRLMTHGGRSMSIWDQNGLLVFDSGDQVARITASIHGEAFNNGEDTNTGDLGSAAKGAEPKALALGEVNGRTYAFLGLEGMGGIVVFDITNPYDVTFIDYFSNRGLVEGEAISGDLAPATMTFIGKEKSSTGEALLVIGNQISGSVAIWEIKPKYQ